MRNLFKMKLRHTDCYLHKRLTKYFTRENISKLTWKGPLEWKKKCFAFMVSRGVERVALFLLHMNGALGRLLRAVGCAAPAG